MESYLVLENGEIFKGNRIGYKSSNIFEIIFNTAMSGYMETLTDPSYTGQGIVFTYPLIGNYGVMSHDTESKKIWASAIIVHELADFSSNFRRECNLNDFLIKNKMPGLQGVNTRALTKIIRDQGTMRATIVDDVNDIDAIISELKSYKAPLPVELVSVKKPQTVGEGKIKIGLLDFGYKLNILKNIIDRKCQVIILPSDTSFEKILKYKFDGIVLSNGPGDPLDNPIAIETIKKLYNTDIPILGICLGHQLLALATGSQTTKMKFGHHGPNHPVKNLSTNRIYITSQNHGYCVVESTLKPNISYVTYRNVNDKTIEGLKYKNKKILTVQFHPEACAGPQDTSYIFDDFLKTIKGAHHA